MKENIMFMNGLMLILVKFFMLVVEPVGDGRLYMNTIEMICLMNITITIIAMLEKF